MVVQQRVRTTSFIDEKTLSLFEKLAFVVAGSGLLILSSKMMVPFWPVPLTFQGLAVILLGIILGPRLALAATVAYLAEGAAGLPVFAESISYPGLAVLTKPTAGFLLSFPIAAYAAGWLSKNDWTRGWSSSIGLFAICTAIIYIIGTAWLISMVGADVALHSMWICVPGDIAKIGLGVTGVQLYRALKIKK
jgi:biotin transport system substrate-specific component